MPAWSVRMCAWAAANSVRGSLFFECGVLSDVVSISLTRSCFQTRITFDDTT